MFISRWDVAVRTKAPKALRDQLGIAVAGQTYQAYRSLVDSPPWQRLFNAGARRQRLLWASTETKDPEASDILYVHSLASAFTVNTMPEATLKALIDHGEIARRCPYTPAPATRCWPNSPRPALTPMAWPPNSRRKGPNRSSSPGTS